MREFKDVLRQLRQNAGMTQAELGKSSVSQKYTAESPVALVTAGFSLWFVYCASIIEMYSDKFQAIKKSSRRGSGAIS